MSSDLIKHPPATAAGDLLLSVRDLTTHFIGDEGIVRAVDGVDFDVCAGKTLGIVGETGCGKSVTARSVLRVVDDPGRIVAGEVLLRRDSGWVDVTKLKPHGRELRSIRGGDIGFIFQEPMTSFSPVHTVGNQIVEAVRLHRGVPKAAAHEQAIELLTMAEIPRPDDVMREYPWQLSGGLRQRAMIAMALAGEPKLLIADEPTTALDVTTQAQILELVRDLQRRTGLAIMLITHDLGVVAEMADEVVVMYLGRVAEKGPVDDIFYAPKHPYTRALLRSIPRTNAGARTKLVTIAGSVPHPFDHPAGCSFHPRCPHAMPGMCDTKEPSPEVLRDDPAHRHEVNCHLYNGAGNDAPDTVMEVVETAAASPDEPRTRPLTGSAAPVLEVRNLRKFFPVRSGQFGRVRGYVRAVDDVSFTLAEGETLALVGESGSGKTTASRCILRALAPDSGEIKFRSTKGVVELQKLSTKDLRPLRPELQMIFQDPYSSLNPRMTVLDIVGEPLLVNGVHGKVERIERVEELLGLVGLRREYLRRFPHAFSGGQRQRIAIARALALNPQLIVADEPVSALDVSVRAQTLNLMLDLQDRLGLTYLFVSHDLSVVEHISDRVAVMYVGQIVELGTRQEIFAQPRHPYTATLLAAVPTPDPRARRVVSPPRGEVANPAKPPSGCYFHPRCSFAVERCKVERPVWEEISSGHRVRCHRAAELDLAAVKPAE